MYRLTEACYQLSDEELANLWAKVEESLEKVGGKWVVVCSTLSSEWQFFGVKEYPDIEAHQKHIEDLHKLDWFRYVESPSMLGTKWEPSSDSRSG